MKNILSMMLVVLIVSIFSTAIGCQITSHGKEGVDIFKEVFDTCYDRAGGFLMLIALAFLSGYRIQAVKKP